MNKIRVAVIFGGTNTEHEVSLVSARAIINNLNPNKYEILPIKITKQNTWQVAPQLLPKPQRKSLTATNITKTSQRLPGLDRIEGKKIDVVFPVIHGPYGEDGTIQGMLEMSRLPYVGCGVLGSAVCMDKIIQKQICESQRIPTPKYSWIIEHDWTKNKIQQLKKIEAKLRYPLFVKPANQGSSIGISKTNNKSQLKEAIEHAFELDQKVIIEQGIPNAREIECSILGNEEPKASILGEIISSNEFYDYGAKYVNGKSKEQIPAKLPKNTAKEIRNLAIKSFKILNCSGLARVDFLLDDKTGKYYLNELNTMPGFTSISMYPKLWEASGVSYSKLLDRLIQFAIDRHQKRSNINLEYTPKKDWYNK